MVNLALHPENIGKDERLAANYEVLVTCAMCFSAGATWYLNDERHAIRCLLPLHTSPRAKSQSIAYSKTPMSGGCKPVDQHILIQDPSAYKGASSARQKLRQ